jgi:hypothetical protein
MLNRIVDESGKHASVRRGMGNAALKVGFCAVFMLSSS